MPGKHENPGSYQSIVSDFVTGRAAELVEQVAVIDPLDLTALNTWIGSATEILREMTRNA